MHMHVPRSDEFFVKSLETALDLYKEGSFFFLPEIRLCLGVLKSQVHDDDGDHRDDERTGLTLDGRARALIPLYTHMLEEAESYLIKGESLEGIENLRGGIMGLSEEKHHAATEYVNGFLQHVVQYLSIQDICRVSKVSRAFHKVAINFLEKCIPRDIMPVLQVKDGRILFYCNSGKAPLTYQQVIDKYIHIDQTTTNRACYRVTEISNGKPEYLAMAVREGVSKFSNTSLDRSATSMCGVGAGVTFGLSVFCFTVAFLVAAIYEYNRGEMGKFAMYTTAATMSFLVSLGGLALGARDCVHRNYGNSTAMFFSSRRQPRGELILAPADLEAARTNVSEQHAYDEAPETPVTDAAPTPAPAPAPPVTDIRSDDAILIDLGNDVEELKDESDELKEQDSYRFGAP